MSWNSLLQLNPKSFQPREICRNLGPFRRASNGRLLSVSVSPGENGASHKDAGQVDSAGQAILKLLHKAAGAAEANSRQALETAQQLSSQLRAAAERIAELEAEIQHYREKSERAEEWLGKISMEIRIALLTSRTTSDGKCRGGAKAPHRASTNDRRRRSASYPS